MTKSHRFATALLFLSILPGGTVATAEATDDATATSAVPSMIQREWVARDFGADAPAAANAAPSTCSDAVWTAKQPLNSQALTAAVVSEFGGTYPNHAQEGRLVAGVLAALGVGNINALKWWGISDEWDPDKTPDPDFGQSLQKYCGTDDAANRQFRIVFYSNDGGRPGQPLAIRTNIPTDVLTNVDWNGNSDVTQFVAEYTATFANPIDATDVVWFGVRRDAGPTINGNNECVFLWTNESTETYDETWAQNTVLMNTGDAAFDLTYCLQKGTATGNYTDIYHADFERGDFRYWSNVQNAVL